MSFDDTEDEPFQKPDTCKVNHDIILLENVTLTDVKLYCLHPKFDTPFLLFTMETSHFEYLCHVDHNDFHCSLGNSALYDLTNYPTTIDPAGLFDQNQVHPQKILQIQSSYYDDSVFIVDLVSYQPHCPERPLTPENFTSKTQIKIGTIKVYYYHEYLATRFMDYLTYQFLDSLSARDSVAESLAQYEKHKQSHEGMDLYDVFYCNPFSSLDVTIAQPLIYLKPRLHYNDYFLIDLGDMHIWNARQKVPGRWLKHPDEKLLCDIYHMDTSSLTISFNECNTVLNPCHFCTQFEFACIEAYDYPNHSPVVLDQSMHVKADAPKTLKLSMRPEHYTYALKCLDLNLVYTDKLAPIFIFRPVTVNALHGGMRYTMECSIPVISFLALNCDGSFLTEFVAKDVSIGVVTNNDLSKLIAIGISYFYALHEKTPDEKKSIIIAPMMSANQVPADDSFYTAEVERSLRLSNQVSLYTGGERKQVDIRLAVSKNYEKDWKVTVELHKMHVKLYLLMLLSHFFIDGFPNYKNSPELPNECIIGFTPCLRQGRPGEVREGAIQAGANQDDAVHSK